MDTNVNSTQSHQRAIWREQQQRRRQRMTVEQREAHLARRRELYRLKRMNRFQTPQNNNLSVHHTIDEENIDGQSHVDVTLPIASASINIPGDQLN